METTAWAIPTNGYKSTHHLSNPSPFVYFNRGYTEPFYSRLNFWEQPAEVTGAQHASRLEWPYITNSPSLLLSDLRTQYPGPSFSSVRACISKQHVSEVHVRFAWIPLGVPSCLGFTRQSELLTVSIWDSESCLFLSRCWGALADSELFLVLIKTLLSPPEMKHRFVMEDERKRTLPTLLSMVDMHIQRARIRATLMGHVLNPKEKSSPVVRYSSSSLAIPCWLFMHPHSPANLF